MKGTRCARSGLGISAPDASSVCGRSSSLRDKGRNLASIGDTKNRRLASVRLDDSGKEIEVVVDDVGMNRLTCHVHHPGARLAKQEQQERVALLVGLQLAGGQLDVDVRGRDHHDGLLIGVEVVDRRPQGHQLRLQGVEGSLVPRVERVFHRADATRHFTSMRSGVRRPATA